jgi:hypothetical protein
MDRRGGVAVLIDELRLDHQRRPRLEVRHRIRGQGQAQRDLEGVAGLELEAEHRAGHRAVELERRDHHGDEAREGRPDVHGGLTLDQGARHAVPVGGGLARLQRARLDADVAAALVRRADRHLERHRDHHAAEVDDLHPHLRSLRDRVQEAVDRERQALGPRVGHREAVGQQPALAVGGLHLHVVHAGGVPLGHRGHEHGVVPHPDADQRALELDAALRPHDPRRPALVDVCAAARRIDRHHRVEVAPVDRDELVVAVVGERQLHAIDHRRRQLGVRAAEQRCARPGDDDDGRPHVHGARSPVRVSQ